MKIQLIHPSLQKTTWYQGCEGPKVASLTLPTVAAVTPKDVDISITDERIESVDYDSGPDLVGITFMSRLAKRAYHIASEFRKRGSTVVLGGIHPTAMPEEALQFADAVVSGEAELAWPQLVEDFKKGCLQRFYRGKELHDLKGLPFARRDLLAGKKYLTRNVMQATRGCPHHCSFCFTSKMNRNKFRARPVADVIREIGTLKGRAVLFLDDNIIGNREYALELFSQMRQTKKGWFSQCDITIARDEELLRAAVKGGCKTLLIGFETLSSKNLRGAHKTWSKVDEYKRAVKKLQDYGISIIASFIVGFDSDDDHVFEEILDFMTETKIEFLQCNPLAYFPGTDMMLDPEAMERLTKKKWWLSEFRHHYEVYHTPKYLTRENVLNGCLWLYKQFYSYKAMVKRHLRIPLPMQINSLYVNFGFKSICNDIPLPGFNPAQEGHRSIPEWVHPETGPAVEVVPDFAGMAERAVRVDLAGQAGVTERTAVSSRAEELVGEKVSMSRMSREAQAMKFSTEHGISENRASFHTPGGNEDTFNKSKSR
jgi:radical SAM superfamily enzyme YgiQ (UPF0313 family)